MDSHNHKANSGDEQEAISGDYFVVKAKEQGVTVIGLTRGKDTRFHHTEKLDKGEVLIAQFTDHTSAVKVRGKAIVMTKHGVIDTDE
ncbi:transcription attenuation protein (tryptophan RNA-binding attenuator protein) [Paenibacillus anaericanus]|uniref:Transcription attenuation protein MtrB n=1 Tax=Paenibacillus anaericanus TaxID=170367 RepID=A0A433YCW1_9BACL|nr:trp RNA-binding attenuation protein MtrB [Paenibacillus anaericanus]MDQ0088124.1 transcription attenuation protein (tryptophan RNA-binding attenuator protein) [Paenibacillus anaericanus]RUT47678.1 trp RNA-binding attenuation protein MtrB [Paenibacillus anaericanus]